jgi:DNA polymerase-3 subunit epsilon
MIREIVLDTETTGLDPVQGHRLVEIACVELVNHVPTGQSFHSYVNPERDVPEEVVAVHGLTAAFLADFPTFAEVADPFLEFIGESPLLIHNAVFDVRFINAELGRIGREPLGATRASCTLLLAQRRFPGAPTSLDALCKRFAVDASARTLHGALLDCQLLAEVYLHLLGGRQADLGLVLPGVAAAVESLAAAVARPARPHRASEAELAAHAAFVAGLPDAIWNR